MCVCVCVCACECMKYVEGVCEEGTIQHVSTMWCVDKFLTGHLVVVWLDTANVGWLF